VSDDDSETISIVLPTYNRATALRANLEKMLQIGDVGEVVVVDDGSSDDTAAVLAALDDPRVKIVTHTQNKGVAAARNNGVRATTGAWILFGEDDCRFPPDYALTLRAEAHRHGADIVGAPLLHVTSTDEEIARVAARVPRRTAPPTMDEVDVFPAEAMMTPFLPARVLVRRSVFDQVQFYEGFDSNAYREETDFFVQAAQHGFTLLLTPDTYCYQFDTWTGGQHHSSSLSYEYWTVRNNWRFLRRNGAWLHEQGYIPDPRLAQVSFVIRRVRLVAGGMISARVGRARAART
jgi:GT2 family glycosyltransferase